MTPEEKKAAVKTAKIIRTSRKLRGWTQVETAQKIGISQSALSKMESGVLIPSVHQWFEFCSSAGIPADSHVQGYLDRLEMLRFQDTVAQKDFKVSQLYRNHAGSSARSMMPLLNGLFTNLGDIKAKKLVKEMGVDPDYFVDMGSQINFRFFVDLFQVMKKKGIYKKSDLSQITSETPTQKIHGGLVSSYQQAINAESLLKLGFSKSSFYEVNFSYKIEESSTKKLSFSIIPKEHLLMDKQLQFDEARDFLNDYRTAYFKNFVDQLGTKQIAVKNVACVSDERARNVYEMSFS